MGLLLVTGVTSAVDLTIPGRFAAGETTRGVPTNCYFITGIRAGFIDIDSGSQNGGGTVVLHRPARLPGLGPPHRSWPRFVHAVRNARAVVPSRYVGA